MGLYRNRSLTILKCGKNNTSTLSCAMCATFVLYHISMLYVKYYWADA